MSITVNWNRHQEKNSESEGLATAERLLNICKP